MVVCCGVLAALVATGFWLTSDPAWKISLGAATVIFPATLLPALIRLDQGEREKRDAALTLPWIALLIVLIPCLVVFSAKLRVPLRDDLFTRMDQALGLSVPAIMESVSGHRLAATMLIRSYSLLSWLIAAAVFIPTLMGKKKAAERFLLANTICFLVALPVFTALPAVGPWVGYHFAAVPVQKVCEEAIMGLRAGKSATASIVCFPSFHAIWAILSAAALWSIRPLRIVSMTVATLIVISTVTTGWHYAVDTLAAILFAFGSLVCADALLHGGDRQIREQN